jgi:hypothetical protein
MLSKVALAVLAITLLWSGGVAFATTWVKLTSPSGRPIFINVLQITAVRSDTEVPGARSQLDLANGKFQGVQESADRIMDLISAAPGHGKKDQVPDG